MSNDARTRRYGPGRYEGRGSGQSLHLIKQSLHGNTTRKEISKGALEDRYTPEGLFSMLKEYEFEGRLASVGIQGPRSIGSRGESESSDSSILSQEASVNHNSKSGKQDIWTDEAEFAFLAAELYLPPATSPKVIFMQKPCGRNEIIALIITLALGKHMTRKQVSSHLQVVRQRKRMNAEVKGLFDQNANDRGQGRLASPGIGTPKLYNVHRRLYDIIGIDPTCNLSDMGKPQWIAELEHDPSHRARLQIRTGKSHYGVAANRQGLSRSKAAAIEDKRAKYFDLPLSTKAIGSRVRQAQRIQNGRKDRESSSAYLFHGTHTDFDELESDGGDALDIEQVSESTPRASPGPEGLSHHAAQTSSSLCDFQLRYVSTGSYQDLPFVHAELPAFLDRVYAADIPDIAMRFAEWPGSRSKLIERRCIHVVVGINIDDIRNLRNGLLDFDLIVSAKNADETRELRLPTICTTSGYLDLRKECATITDLDFTNGSITKTLQGGDRVSFRPIDVFEDGLLIQLATSSADPANAVLPYFWIMQEIATLRACLRILYTFEANPTWSLAAKEVV